jgi:hypothetical protein
VAVDQAADVVYVDGGLGTVEKFNENGEPQEFSGLGASALTVPGATPTLYQLAVDNSCHLNGLSGAACTSADPSNGDLYVADYGDGVVDRYTPAGALAGEITGLSVGAAVAVDSAGDLYVAQFSAGNVLEFSATGAPLNGGNPVVEGLTEPNALALNGLGELYVAETGVGTFEFLPNGAGGFETPPKQIDANSAFGVAVDVATSRAFADNYAFVEEFDSAGTQLGSAFGAPNLDESNAVAVSEGTKTVFVTNRVTGTVERFVPAPETNSGPASEVTASSATLHGTINPENIAVTGCQFEYGTDTSYGQSAECQPDAAEIGAGDTPVEVSATITALQPHTNYHYRLAATNANGRSDGQDAQVTTISPPLIETEEPSDVLVTIATLNAKIDPAASATTYHIEYGPDTNYGTSAPVPDTNIGSANEYSQVSYELHGLQGATTYHYRFVATNAHGTTNGPDHVFTTQPAPPAPGSEHCPNESLRTGRSASLPDCRAYELVTPSDIGRTQALTFTEGATHALAARNGEAIALETIVPLEPNPSFVGARDVFSRNPITGWQPTSAVAPEANMHIVTMRLFSSAFSQILLERENDDRASALWIETGPVGGPYAVIAEIPPEDHRATIGTQVLGASADLTHLLFASVDHDLLAGPTGTDAHGRDLYDWTGNHLELVNVQGGAFTNPCGAALGDATPEHINAGTSYSAAANAVSNDGSKIFFTSPNPEEGSTEPGCQEPSQLYMRASGETVAVSKPAPGATPAQFFPVRYNYATANGSKLFFNTRTALTANETPEQAGANKLFEYDAAEPEGKRLKLIAAGFPEDVGVGKDNQEGVNFSEDGSTVYVWTPPNVGLRQIYRVDTATGASSFVAVAHEPGRTDEPSYSTPDGAFYLFSADGVEGEPRSVGHHEQLYRYSHADGSVMCVTCGAGFAPPEGEVSVRGTLLAPPDNNGSPRAQLSESGQQVFFQTTARLVPEDTNSTETDFESSSGLPGLDVYEWEAQGTGGCALAQGCTHLLSGGEASGPSTFIGASADGDNAFFVSAARLVPQAAAEFPNIYDARVGGGFAPASGAPECSSCQGVGSPPPAFDTPASASFVGAGNPAGPPAAPAAKPTRAQLLAQALSVCRRKTPKRKRVACEKQAKRRYGGVAAKARRSSGRANRRGK